MKLFTKPNGEERTSLISSIVLLIAIGIVIITSIIHRSDFLAFLFMLIPYVLLTGYYTVKELADEWEEEVLKQNNNKSEPYNHIIDEHN